MKKELLKYGILLFASLLITGCSSNDDIQSEDSQEINNPDQRIDTFVWNAMNLWYLYKSDVLDLQDSKNDNINSFRNFLASFDSPEDVFEGLRSKQILQGKLEDQFSFFIDDYIAFEQSRQGISESNGMNFRLTLASEGSNDVLGFVRYVAPGSDADKKGIKRGDFFNTVNGNKLTRSTDFGALFSLNTYTIGLVTINGGGTITETGENISLTKEVFTENPILISKTLDYQGQKIGYIMYNSFIFNFDNDLNNAFGELKSNGITDLILDLRYNLGGAGSSAADLASMITGQFANEVLFKREYNDVIQNSFVSQNPESVITRFPNTLLVDQSPINSLNLTRVYILTTGDSASASELIINALDPYIDVIQIGEATSGKFQGSITLYDSNDLSRDGNNLNPNHNIALQPLVVKAVNRDGISDFITGILPEVPFNESFLNLGILGETDEPLLKAALDFIVDGQIPAAVFAKTDFNKNTLNFNPEPFSSRNEGLFLEQSNFHKLYKTISDKK